MALADFDAYLAAIAAPSQSVQFCRTQANPITASRWISLWVSSGGYDGGGNVLPSAPSTTGALFDRTSQGAVGQRNASVGELRVWLRNINASCGAAVMIADRVAAVGGLDGTSTGAQTVGFPALTRYTSGERLMAGIEVYSTIGSSGTTATIAYTANGGGSHTSQAIAVGGTGLNNAGRFLPFSLADNDIGMTAVATVTLAATTGTVGNFGVTLLRPLVIVPLRILAECESSGDPLRAVGFNLPKVEDDACLQFLYMQDAQGAATSQIGGDLCFMDV